MGRGDEDTKKLPEKKTRKNRERRGIADVLRVEDEKGKENEKTIQERPRVQELFARPLHKHCKIQ